MPVPKHNSKKLFRRWRRINASRLTKVQPPQPYPARPGAYMAAARKSHLAASEKFLGVFTKHMQHEVARSRKRDEAAEYAAWKKKTPSAKRKAAAGVLMAADVANLPKSKQLSAEARRKMQRRERLQAIEVARNLRAQGIAAKSTQLGGTQQPWSPVLQRVHAGIAASKGKLTVPKTKKRIAAKGKSERPAPPAPQIKVKGLPDAELRNVKTQGLDDHRPELKSNYVRTKAADRATKKMSDSDRVRKSWVTRKLNKKKMGREIAKSKGRMKSGLGQQLQRAKVYGR